jgi:hypothetical protein
VNQLERRKPWNKKEIAVRLPRLHLEFFQLLWTAEDLDPRSDWRESVVGAGAGSVATCRSMLPDMPLPIVGKFTWPGENNHTGKRNKSSGTSENLEWKDSLWRFRGFILGFQGWDNLASFTAGSASVVVGIWLSSNVRICDFASVREGHSGSMPITNQGSAFPCCHRDRPNQTEHCQPYRGTPLPLSGVTRGYHR